LEKKYYMDLERKIVAQTLKQRPLTASNKPSDGLVSNATSLLTTGPAVNSFDRMVAQLPVVLEQQP
jgi:hypothetical protein